MKKRIFICEDHQIYIDGLANLINSHPEEFELIESCQNGSYAAKKIPFLQIDILLLGLNVPGLNGFEIMEMLRPSHPELKIIVISMYDDPVVIKKAKDAGANAYLLKDVPNEILLDTLRTPIDHSFQLQDGLTHLEDSVFTERFSNAIKLTLREKEVVQLVVEGNTSPQIADRLFLSVNTIETHRRNIYRKLDVKTLPQLIHLAHTHDLVI